MNHQGYAEMQVTSNFTFLRGASHPEELVERACELGLRAISLTDINSFAGLVRAHIKAKEKQIRFIPGCRIDLGSDHSLLCWPKNRNAYARLSKLISMGKRRAAKGTCLLYAEDLTQQAEDLIVASLSCDEKLLGLLKPAFGGRLFLTIHHFYQGNDETIMAQRAKIAKQFQIRLLATNDVHYHLPERRPLQDVLTCIREHCRIDEAGKRLYPNAERHLKSPAAMLSLFENWPDAIQAGLDIAQACRFSMDELGYDYPIQADYQGLNPQEELERRTWAGAERRYGRDIPPKVSKTLQHELSLINELNYAPYFLTVDEIVAFARSRDILCQGRGSAANSAVCYVLGITAVDPSRVDLLFERFISAERNEPPDIDVDFEHERREEVIQHIYERFGREHAALCATVVRYRSKSAIREVGKVMGLSLDTIDALSKTVWGYGSHGWQEQYISEAGLDPGDPYLKMTLELAQEIIDFPRHLSQHVGGFIIAKSPLDELVPIENAAMADRTVVEWDKDDIEALGMLKIDLLALGMLTCIRKAFDLLRHHYQIDIDLARVPAEDPAVYEMLQRADTIGVFQIESRAQMSMLPRLKPRSFYDLVIEVAIVRPGPIQGDMVHPYLKRRDGSEPVTFPSKELEEVLGKTLGVPLFQEQAMRIAIVAAGFTPSEADGLRRSMATFKRKGALEQYHRKLVNGMAERGYDRDFAERCFKQIEGFGYYGFPESHAASFALLVYVSAWLKRHFPDVFAAAILNSQPMGFYAPAQLLRDAIDHGVEARHVDVNASYWDYTLEPLSRHQGPMRTAVRLGFRQIKGMSEQAALRIVTARLKPYRSVFELKQRSGIDRRHLELLAQADALRSLGMDRRQALWAVKALKDKELPLFEYADSQLSTHDNRPYIEDFSENWLVLPPMDLGEHVLEDYTFLRLSLKAHPMALLRGYFQQRYDLKTSQEIWHEPPGKTITAGGLVIVRQRPGSAKGVVFSTLEDETGFINCVVWPDKFERFRPIVMRSRLVLVRGYIQREGNVIHLIAQKMIDATPEIARLRREGLSGVPPLSARAFAHETKKPDTSPKTILPGGRNFH